MQPGCPRFILVAVTNICLVSKICHLVSGRLFEQAASTSMLKTIRLNSPFSMDPIGLRICVSGFMGRDQPSGPVSQTRYDLLSCLTPVFCLFTNRPRTRPARSDRAHPLPKANRETPCRSYPVRMTPGSHNRYRPIYVHRHCYALFYRIICPIIPARH